jgi:hypothetical protein
VLVLAEAALEGDLEPDLADQRVAAVDVAQLVAGDAQRDVDAAPRVAARTGRGGHVGDEQETTLAAPREGPLAVGVDSGLRGPARPGEERQGEGGEGRREASDR